MHEEICDTLTSSFQIRSHMIRYAVIASVCAIMTRADSCKLYVCDSYSMCQVAMKRVRVASCSHPFNKGPWFQDSLQSIL